LLRLCRSEALASIQRFGSLRAHPAPQYETNQMGVTAWTMASVLRHQMCD
jgi:hypothetical protein